MSFSYENKGAYSFLTYEFDPDDVIDRFGLGMLTNNKISGLAEAYDTNVDNHEQLKYNISSRINARNYLSGPVTRKQLLNFLSGIINAASALDDYLLDIRMLYLNLDYIFVDVKNSELNLILLPVSNTKSPELIDFIRSVIFSLYYSQEENSSYVTALMNFINRREKLDLTEFQDMLSHLGEPEKKPEINSEHPASVSQIGREEPAKTQPELPRRVEFGLNDQGIAAAGRETGPMDPEIQIPQISSVKETPTVENNEEPAKPERKGFFRWGSKSKGNAAKEKKQKKTGKKPENKQENGAENNKPKNSGYAFSVPGMDRSQDEKPAQQYGKPLSDPYSILPVQQKNTVESREPNRYAEKPAAAPAAIQELPVLDEETVYLPDESDETVIMGEEGSGMSLKPQLIRKRNNEQIPITKNLFRIGRDFDFNDYAVIGNRHVGHTHCHIVIKDGEYFVVDDNSKNHTRVNGNLIPPGTEIKLAHGYIITAADEDFEFKLF